ncbi:MAG: hypothetical protein GXY05_14615 [Clostridiales bacterium]|nr:hypothetical protein [Clostridiales bacterium]
MSKSVTPTTAAFEQQCGDSGVYKTGEQAEGAYLTKAENDQQKSGQLEKSHNDKQCPENPTYG